MRGILGAAASVMAIVASQPLAAQTAPAPEAANGIDASEIVVTAQRRAERLQDVPVTITAFGAEAIETKRMQAISDVAGLTPGLSFDAFPSSQPRPFIRGIGSSDTGAAGDPSVAVFVDEVYLGRPAAVAFDAFDVERIEVLKGPQGTLYGRNVVGGAISVITRRPDVDAFDASVEATVGNYDRREAAAYVNIPFAEGTGAVRASASLRTHDGYAKNAYTGGELDDQNTKSGRIQFYGAPTERFNTLFTIDGTRDRGNGPAQYVFDRTPGSPQGALWTVSQTRKDTAPEIDGFQNRDTWGIRNETNLELPFAMLTFIGSYRELKYRTRYDFDGGNPTYNRAGLFASSEEDSHFSSQEVRLSSLPESRLKWVAGFYHFNQQVERSSRLQLYSRSSLAAPVPSVFGTDVYLQNAGLDSIAVFGDVTVPLGERVRVFGGLRYSKDDKDYRIDNRASTALFRASERFNVAASDSFDAVTYRGGIDFKPTEDLLLYGQVSKGFKSGGYQDTPGTAASAVVSFKPEYATQFEIGQKGEFFGGKLIWNNTLYYIDYKDLQARQVVGLGVIVSNAGKATIKGYETQAIIRPFRGAQLDVAYAYTDAKFDEFLDGTQDLSGNRISRTPKHKLVVAPSYEVPVGDFSVTLSGEYRYESKIYDDNTNNAIQVRAPSHFVDARLVIEAPSKTWSLALWAENLTKEETRTFQTEFFGANFGALAAPRTYGATLRWKY